MSDTDAGARFSVRLGEDQIEYLDTGGDGETLVFLHGMLMDEELWKPVVDRLAGHRRCVVPVLPLGAHRIPRSDGADQTPRGVARLIGTFIREVARGKVTLLGSDTGGALAQLVIDESPELIDRLILVSCDAFENFPPGLPGRTMAIASRVPGGLRSAMASLRFAPLRRLPMTFGWMSKRPIATGLFTRWLDAFAADSRIARDTGEFMRSVNRRVLVEAAEGFHRFVRPVLIVWAAEDKVMPLQHAHDLAAAFPNARVEFFRDCRTLISLDRPAALADVIRAFVDGESVGSSVVTSVPGRVRKCKWYNSTGVWCMTVAVGHLLTTEYFYGESLRAITSGPLVGALDADPDDPAARGAAFWYVAAGVALLGLGWGAWRGEAIGRPPGAEFAASLSALGLAGVVASPASPFWLVLFTGVVAEVRRRTQLPRRRAGAEIGRRRHVGQAKGW